MDSTTFDTITRTVSASMPHRTALRGLLTGAVTTVAGGALLQANDTSAKRRKRKKKAKKQQTTPIPTPAPMSAPTSEPDPLPEPNPCAEKNWCVDRSQTRRPASGHGKCLVEAGGGNICAEILFQVPTCADCAAPRCTNCRCALAA